jgi:hypothetical protein
MAIRVDGAKVERTKSSYSLKSHARALHLPNPNVPAANIADVSAIVQVYADVLGVYDGGHR